MRVLLSVKIMVSTVCMKGTARWHILFPEGRTTLLFLVCPSNVASGRFSLAALLRLRAPLQFLCFCYGTVCRDEIEAELYQAAPEGAAAGSVEQASMKLPKQARVVCSYCGKGGAKLSSCSACRGAVYCSRECQKGHWPKHKGACKAARGAGGASSR